MKLVRAVKMTLGGPGRAAEPGPGQGSFRVNLHLVTNKMVFFKTLIIKLFEATIKFFLDILN